jgi:signal transduction histidine kinase
MQSLLKPEQHINFYFIGEAGEVVLDRNLFRNILMNLLSNAVKYSPDGSIVHFKAQLSQDKVQIEVQDQGIGIPEEEQSHLFERFFRAKNATNLQGTGLGLNITKKHIELMQGELTFKSQLNEGSTFQATLPRRLESE